MLVCKDIRICSDDFGAIFVDPRTGEWFGANPVASFLLSLLVAPRSIEEMISAVMTEFSVDEATADRDVRHFCEMLLSKRIAHDFSPPTKMSRGNR